MRRRIQGLLWNRSERRLRTPWRLVLGTVLLLVVSIAVILTLQLAGGPVWTTIAGFGPATQPLVLNAVVGLVIVVVLVPMARLVDRRYFTDYGLRIDREWWVGCGTGLLIGAVAMTAVFLVGVAGGWIAIETVGLSGGTLPLFAVLVAVFLVVGVYEELLIRGFLLTNLIEGLQWFDSLDYRVAAAGATLLSSLVFGGLHATNPNATAVSTTVISAAGVMLAIGYLSTGELAVPIGVHITWNAFQGLVYGFPVSGVGLPVSVVGTTVRGPQLAAGGPFGPEAGLLGLFGVIVATLGIIVYSRLQYGTLAIASAVLTPDLRDSSSTN